MKLFSAILFFFICSCSKIGDIVSGEKVSIHKGPCVFSEKLLTPAQTATKLAFCFDGNGTPFKIEPDDQFRIRFYTRIGDTLKSIEKTIPASVTVNDLMTEITKACDSVKAVVSAAPDSSGSGAFILTVSGTPIKTLIVENITNPQSMAVMPKVFLWEGDLTSGMRSAGECLALAEKDSPLKTLKNSTGGDLGIETGDTVLLKGSTPKGYFPKSEQIVIDTTAPTLDLFLKFLEKAVEKSILSVGNPIIEKESGRITVELPSEPASAYTMWFSLTKNRQNRLAPGRFNTAFIFRP